MVHEPMVNNLVLKRIGGMRPFLTSFIIPKSASGLENASAHSASGSVGYALRIPTYRLSFSADDVMFAPLLAAILAPHRKIRMIDMYFLGLLRHRITYTDIVARLKNLG
jgi:hypothetical protein